MTADGSQYGTDRRDTDHPDNRGRWDDRLMGEGIPTKIASALLSVRCDAPQNAPGANTIH